MPASAKVRTAVDARDLTFEVTLPEAGPRPGDPVGSFYGRPLRDASGNPLSHPLRAFGSGCCSLDRHPEAEKLVNAPTRRDVLSLLLKELETWGEGDGWREVRLVHVREIGSGRMEVRLTMSAGEGQITYPDDVESVVKGAIDDAFSPDWAPTWIGAASAA